MSSTQCVAVRPQYAPALDSDTVLDAYGGLVRKIAWHVYARMAKTVELADLIQIGLIALLEAARAFEDRGFAFSTYAATRVRGAMIDELRRHSTGARTASKSRRQLSAVRSALEQQHFRPVGDAEMAEALEMDAPTYRNFVATSQSAQFEPLDDVYTDQSMWFADAAEAADAQMEGAQIREQLAACIGELPPREAMILQLYFVEELNLEEIGRVLDVGAARVCQIKRSALLKLRGMMEGAG